MTHPPAGGPATINGIVYQMLWSLLQAVEIHIVDTDVSPDGTAGTKARLVLEPRGGGDLQRLESSGRRIQQLKAKPAGGTWSLQEIVTEVLPDLYLALSPTQHQQKEVVYEFITEGRRGGWKEVEEFFGFLKERSIPDTGVLDGLDDTKTLPFRHQTTGKEVTEVAPPSGALTASTNQTTGTEETKPFWLEPTYTERKLFAHIVAYLRQRKAIIDRREDEETTRRNLWHLLGRFKFVPDQTATSLQSKIDRILLEMVDRDTHLVDKRDALLLALARAASHGDAVIEAEHFFNQHSLGAVPLSRWSSLMANAAKRLQGQLLRLGYDTQEDVRRSGAEAMLHTWQPDTTPLMALQGESGQGKSWLLYSMGSALADTNPVVLIEALGDVEATLRQAAAVFWQEIGEHDDDLPLHRVAARLRSISKQDSEVSTHALLP